MMFYFSNDIIETISRNKNRLGSNYDMVNLEYYEVIDIASMYYVKGRSNIYMLDLTTIFTHYINTTNNLPYTMNIKSEFFKSFIEIVAMLYSTYIDYDIDIMDIIQRVGSLHESAYNETVDTYSEDMLEFITAVEYNDSYTPSLLQMIFHQFLNQLSIVIDTVDKHGKICPLGWKIYKDRIIFYLFENQDVDLSNEDTLYDLTE